MPNWLFEKKELRHTPSFQDGIGAETEARYRREGARFIMEVGSSLNLRYDTMATGVVYFQRFFMFHSFKDFNRSVVALSCLFLAGKVEETPKKWKDLMNTAKKLLTEHQFSAFGEDPKEEIMTTERILLQTIRFDLQVQHPYDYLLRYAKVLKGDKQKLQKLVQMAWTFINDSLCTTLCLQWEPEVIAIALMYLASRLSKFDVLDWEGRKGGANERWWDQFVEDLPMELLEDICHQVLDLYSNQPKGSGKVGTTLSAAAAKSALGSTAASPGIAAARSDATKLPSVVPTLTSKAIAKPTLNLTPSKMQPNPSNLASAAQPGPPPLLPTPPQSADAYGPSTSMNVAPPAPIPYGAPFPQSSHPHPSYPSGAPPQPQPYPPPQYSHPVLPPPPIGQMNQLPPPPPPNYATSFPNYGPTPFSR